MFNGKKMKKKTKKRKKDEEPSKGMTRDLTLDFFLKSDDEDDVDHGTLVHPVDPFFLPPVSNKRSNNNKKSTKTNFGVDCVISIAPGIDLKMAAKLRRPLFDAAHNDNVDQLRESIKAIEDTDLALDLNELCNPTDGMTVLHSALDMRKMNAARYLIETQSREFLNRSYVNIKRQIPASTKSCLHMLAEIGDVELTKRLLERMTQNPDDHSDDQNVKERAFFLSMLPNNVSKSNFVNETVVVTADNKKQRVAAIHLAARNGHADLIRPLRSYGVDVDSEDSEKQTALSWAVQQGQMEVVRELINLGCDVDHADAYNCTPLHLAVSLDKKDIVKLLIDEGKADINRERIKSPKTPIEMAANRQREGMVKEILKAGPETSHVHKAMLIASNNGHLNIVRQILTLYPSLLDIPDDNGNTAMLMAATADKLEIVEYLVDEGADLNWTNHLRQTALDIAIQQPDNILLRYLMEVLKKVSGDVKNDGLVLHRAAARGDIEKIKYLTNIGVDDMALDEEANTFLHRAAAHSRENVLDHFLSAYDDIVNIQNSDGETSLHISARLGFIACVQTLLKKKARHICDKNGQTPLHCALNANVSKKMVSSLLDSIRSTNIAILHEQDVDGKTALHIAAAGRRPELVSILFDLDPECENKDGNTPFHIAAQQGSIDVLKAFLGVFCAPGKRGNMDHTNGRGYSALHLSAMIGDDEKVKLLLHYGADMSLKNIKTDNTIIHMLVDSRTMNPLLEEKLIKVYQTLLDEAMYWFCWKNNRKIPKEDSVDFYLIRLDAIQELTSLIFNKKGFNVLQWASKNGCGRLLLEILNTPGVYRFNMNSPLRSPAFKTMGVNKSFDAKSTLMIFLKAHGVLFDVTYLIPGHMVKLPPPGGSEQASRTGSPIKRRATLATQMTKMDPTSCLELIVNHGNEEFAVDVLSKEPFRFLVSTYWTLCRRTYEAFMWTHVIYMICFTYFLMPPNIWLHRRFGTNSSTESPEEENVWSSLNTTPVEVYGIFLLWPVFNLAYTLMVALVCAVRMHSMGDLMNGSIIRNLQIGDITSGLMRIPIGILLLVFDNLSHLSSLAFGASAISWYVMFVYSNDAHSYLESLALSLIFGWMHTITFVKGFKDWNALASILKHILLKDIIRFIYIYIFILISFGYAIHVLIQADYHLNPDYRSPSSTIYLTFYRMLSPGNVLDVSENKNYTSSGGNVAVLRAVCATYSILTTVVLMNMLIAMMNSTYSDVKPKNATAWRMESIRMALWIERRFPILRRFRCIHIKKGIYDPKQRRYYLTYQPQDEKEVYGIDNIEPEKTDIPVVLDDVESDDDVSSERHLHKCVDEMKSEIGHMRQALEQRKEEQQQTLKYVTELKNELKLIHELCLENCQLTRLKRRDDDKI